MALQFTRNANVYVQLTDGVGGNVQAWKLAVLDGFSFSQAINSSEITINEAGSQSRRARLLFNDSLAPVEWSMSTYARPFTSNSEAHSPEEALWAMLLGADGYTTGTRVFDGNSQNITAYTDATNTSWNFSGSNVSSFSDNWNIFFSFEEAGNTQVYKCESSVINSLTMDFDIDGIATLQWSGFAKNLVDVGTSVPTDLTSGGTPAVIEDGLTSTTNFIRNRISTVDLVRTDTLIGSPDDNIVTGVTVDGVNASTGATLNVTGDISKLKVGDTISVTGVVTSSQTVVSILSQEITLSANIDVASSGGEAVVVTSAVSDRYSLVLTGGSFSVENNISYLTPEELGLVNAPLANITGARSISGSLTCYLDNDETNSKSGELFSDLVSDTTTVRNVFDMSVNVGGDTDGAPRVAFDLPTAHLEIPVVNVEDLLTLEVTFHGQVSSGNVDNTDEATVIYKV